MSGGGLARRRGGVSLTVRHSDLAADAAPSAERHRYDAVVICACTASRHLAAQLGDRVNIYPVKGYSITVHLSDAASQLGAPNVSLLDDATKLVTSRLVVERFRVAGTAEFNGSNRNIRADRIAPLVDWVRHCFPGVSTRNVPVGRLAADDARPDDAALDVASCLQCSITPAIDTWAGPCRPPRRRSMPVSLTTRQRAET